MTIEGLNGIIDAFAEEVHVARGYHQQIDTAARIRRYLSDSLLTTMQGEIQGSGCLFASLHSASSWCIMASP